MSIEELKNQGYKIRISHRRPYHLNILDGVGRKVDQEYVLMTRYEAEKEGMFNTMYGPLDFGGGKTVVEVRHPDGREVTGSSNCSTKDQFSRKIGRTIALGRALSQL